MIGMGDEGSKFRTVGEIPPPPQELLDALERIAREYATVIKALEKY